MGRQGGLLNRSYLMGIRIVRGALRQNISERRLNSEPLGLEPRPSRSVTCRYDQDNDE